VPQCSTLTPAAIAAKKQIPISYKKEDSFMNSLKITRQVTASLLCISVLSSVTATELPEDIGVSKTGQKLPYSDIIPASAGPIKVEYNSEGMRTFSKVPAPGIHPRIFHSPEDRDELRRIYRETDGGKYIWKMAMGWIKKLKGEIKNGEYPKTSNGILVASYSAGGWERAALDYKKLQVKDYSVLKDQNLMNYQPLGILCLELYRCWIEDDQAAGKEAATVLAGIAEHLYKNYKIGQPVERVGGYHMGLGYDYGYNFMNENQRKIIRELIAKASRNKAHVGGYIEPEATTSNWVIADLYQTMTILAIEGEKGYNENYYKSFVEAYKKFVTYGWYPSGTPYEGLGKNTQGNVFMPILARRGVPLPAHPFVKAYAKKFLPGVTLPTEGGFMAADDWGGTGYDTVKGNYRFSTRDMIGLKWAYPDDEIVDYIWGIYFGETYEKYTNFIPTGYYPEMLLALMHPLDHHRPKKTRKQLKLPLTYHAPQRGFMTTRSSNDKDAAFLTLHCRQDNGGHCSADRNSFVFAAKGRLWGYQPTLAGGSFLGVMNESRYFSTILIDDKGQCGAALNGCYPVPGKMVEFVDTPELTYAVGDAKYAYDWEWRWENGDPNKDSLNLQRGWTKVEETPNDFQKEKLPYDYMNDTFYMKSHWVVPGSVQHYVKKPWNPVQKAFRTAALIRGEHPYAVIVDDARKSNEKHNYKWLMQASRDLEVAFYDYNMKDSKAPMSITLAGGPLKRNPRGQAILTKGQPLLKVVVARNDTDRSDRRFTPIARLEEYLINNRWTKGTGKRLVIESHSIEPNFRVLFLPYSHGEKIPTTKWLNKERTKLSVTIDTQHDVIDFTTTDKGWTKIILNR
jgi:hypothetical protein